MRCTVEQTQSRCQSSEARTVTTINASPIPSSSRCELCRTVQSASGGQRILASCRASRLVRTPARNATAIAIRFFLSEVIAGHVGTAASACPAQRSGRRQTAHDAASLDRTRLGCPYVYILESVNPCNALADDQRVHVVRAFVSLHRLQVHHVTHDGIVVGNAVSAENVAR
jgi:hypothetical protein